MGKAMIDLTVFADFAARVGAVDQHCNTCNPHQNMPVLHKKNNENSIVTPVTRVTCQFDEMDDMAVAFEERAAFLEYDCYYPRHEAERRARSDIYGIETKVA